MSATAWKRVQLACMIVWTVLIWPSVTIWRGSLPYLVFISVAANILASAAGWAAARAEESAVDKADLEPIRDALEAVLAVQREILARLPRP